jgi:hypothetical protein
MFSWRITLLILIACVLFAFSPAARTVAAPPNDAFQAATIVLTIPYSNTQSTADATLEPGEPPCGDIGSTVWYAITAPQAGTLKVTTAGSDFDTVLAAHTGGALDSLQNLDCNDDTGPTVTSAVQFAVDSRNTYYIQAGGYQGLQGQLSLSVSYATAPVNDDFADAQAVPVNLPYVDNRSTAVASKEPGEPEPDPFCAQGALIGRTVWYSLTLTETRLVKVDTAGSNFDTILVVYTGDTLGNLTSEGCGDDTLDATSEVKFIANAEATYRIQVGGYQGDSGDLAFNLDIDTSDGDGDGFTDESEIIYIGTGPSDPCGNDGWPLELAGDDNRLNIADFASFIFPLRTDGSFRKFGHPVPDPDDASIARWNLDPNAVINIADLNALNPGVNSPTSRPPMFGGQPAFFTNGGVCPFTP